MTIDSFLRTLPQKHEVNFSITLQTKHMYIELVTILGFYPYTKQNPSSIHLDVHLDPY